MAKFINRQNFKNVGALQSKFVFPERYKGTFLEKWVTYWKNLYVDYKEMVKDVVKDVQDKPKKAMYISTAAIAVWQLAKNNPTETDFREDLKRYSNELMLVGDLCKNPKTVEHFKYLESCYNQGVLRKTNLGIASLIWVDNYDEKCDLYKATCNYTQVGYFSILQRTVDIGVMGKWWNIYRKFQDFDVNE